MPPSKQYIFLLLIIFNIHVVSDFLNVFKLERRQRYRCIYASLFLKVLPASSRFIILIYQTLHQHLQLLINLKGSFLLISQQNHLQSESKKIQLIKLRCSFCEPPTNVPRIGIMSDIRTRLSLWKGEVEIKIEGFIAMTLIQQFKGFVWRLTQCIRNQCVYTRRVFAVHLQRFSRNAVTKQVHIVYIHVQWFIGMLL